HKKGAPRVADPRGLKLKWDDLTPEQLARLLDDPRFAVRDRALHTLGKRGPAAVPALVKVLKGKGSTMARRNAVWALTRLDGQAARAAVRAVLADPDDSVRQTAVHSAGPHRDGKGGGALLKALGGPVPAVRPGAAAGPGG